MAVRYPTLDELKASGKNYFTPSEVAGVLGVNLTPSTSWFGIARNS